MVDTSTNSETTNLLVGLSEELLKHERLQGITSLEDLASKYANAKLAPEIPAPDAYKLPEGAPPEIGQFAHDNGFTQSQLDAALKQMTDWGTSSAALERSQLVQQGQAKLAEWGEAKGTNVKLATDAVAYLEAKTPGLRNMLNETGYGDHPLLLEIFREVGLLVKEGGYVAGDVHTPATKKTAAQKMFPSQSNTTK